MRRVHITTMEIAHALYFPHNEYKIPLYQLFGNENQTVINEGLMIAAEYRNLPDMEDMVKLGACVHYVNKAGFSVLEAVLNGRDGYSREDVEGAKLAVLFLHNHGVTRKDITHQWIIEQCCDLFISKDKYMREYLVPTKYAAWWHKPGDLELTSQGEFDQEPVSANKWRDISVDQFLYYVKKNDKEIKKYIITWGFGDATVIPLSETPSIQKKLSWLTTTLMGGLDVPEVPGEYSKKDEV